MSYPKVSVQVATEFFKKIGGDFSFDILTREYIVKIGEKQVSAPTIYQVFMSGAQLVKEIIDAALHKIWTKLPALISYMF